MKEVVLLVLIAASTGALGYMRGYAAGRRTGYARGRSSVLIMNGRGVSYTTQNEEPFDGSVTVSPVNDKTACVSRTTTPCGTPKPGAG